MNNIKRPSFVLRPFVVLKGIVILLALFPATAHAQVSFYQFDSSFKVSAYGKELTLAGCGGFNNPEFSMADLNNDGLPDLVVFERGLGITTFVNKGSSGNPDYRYAPEYALNFPPAYDFVIMADYNCDGITDFFQGSSGFEAYKGYYNASNQLCFSYYKKLLYNNDPAHPNKKAFNNPGDIPSIVDVDGDGDLDVIAYEINGEFMYYYRNMQVEMGLPCDTIHINLRDKCWGKVHQGFLREHGLARTCDNSGLLRPAGDKRTHQGNAICVFDWDMDGDMDYLDGSVSYNELTFMKNGRIEQGSGPDSMISQDTVWQTGGKRVVLPNWPAAFNIDIDQDGKKDLLIAPNAGLGCENYKCIWFYKNMSTPGVPNWQFQSDSFLIDKTIDVGTGSSPVLFDYDKDGKTDLIVGSDGYRQPDGQLKSKLSWYKNTSTPDHPTFVLQTNDLSDISANNFRGAAPAIGDIDNDGKSDLILGHTNGTLSYFKNMAGSDAIQPNWQLEQLMLSDIAGNVINLDGNAAPYIYDINKDGKKDLLIGSVYGYIQYYQNVSTAPGDIKLKLINTKLGMVQADPVMSFGGCSNLFIGKIDNSGIEYMLVGSNSGKVYQYTGFQSGDVTSDYTLVDSQYSFIDTTFNSYNRTGVDYGRYGAHRSAITVGDLDGGGSYSLIAGNIRGGLEFYKRKVYVAGVPQFHEYMQVLVYPNPANNDLNISWSNVYEPDVQFSVINSTGQQLLGGKVASALGHTSLSVAGLANGVYTCVMQSGAAKHYSKFVIIR